MKSITPVRRARGFALIVTLSLMILLSVIAIGLLSLSSISLRGAAKGQAMATARGNARLAMMMALGELQAKVGADTRVTARADILGSDNPPVLGVWKSWEGADHEADGRPIPPKYQDKSSRFSGWLMSGDPKMLAQEDKVPATTSSGSTITLVGASSVGSGQIKKEIHGTPVMLKSNTAPGGYAWWVGGENQKARLPDSAGAGGSVTSAGWAARQQSHPDADPEEFNMPALLGDPSLAIKAVSLKQTDFIPQSGGSELASKEHFHDLSVVSTGLLTNTATGGWRKDLSLFTENYDNLPASGLPVFRVTPDSDLQRARSSASNPTAAGSLFYPWSDYRNGSKPFQKSGAVASWENLRNFALSYRNFSGSSFSMATKPLTAANSDYGYLHQIRPMPVIAKVEWIFYYYSRQSGRYYTPGILLSPVVTLWNPYNVALTGNLPLHITVGAANEASPLPVAFKYRMSDGQSISNFKSLTQGSTNTGFLPALGNVNSIRYRIPTVPNLPPGKTVVFSPDSGTASALGSSSAPVDLVEGFHTNGGHQFLFRLHPDPDEQMRTMDPNVKIFVQTRFDTTSGLNGKSFTGIRLIMRQDDKNSTNTSSTSASRDDSEVEYRMSLDPASAPADTIDVAPSETLGTMQGTSNAKAFLSLTFGTRLAANLFSNSRPFAPSKGVTQANPLVTRTATGEMDSADPTIAYNYPGTSHRVNGSLDFDYSALTGLGSSPDGTILSSLHNGLTRGIMAELPVKPLASLAELQNWDMRAGNPVPPFACNIIANSDASPLLPADSVVNGGGPAAGANLQHDDSYCANHLLFDDWFFSSINGGKPDSFGGSASQLKTTFTGFLTGATPLVNSAYRPLNEDSAVARSDADKVYTDRIQPADSWRKIASRLEVRGMFNVNSTSVTAWRALLGHARGQQIPYYDAAGSVALASKTDHAISRTSIAGDSEAGAAGASGDTELTGYRVLTDAMLDELAQKIVDQIRKRGPFLSLSEFVNRQLSGDKDLALAGAVQTALNQMEKSSSLYRGILDAFDAQNKTSTNLPDAGYQFGEAAVGSALFGLPGWPRQADILRPLAPILSARDDTFTIRGYGDARDAAGKIIASATCEAVVTRTRSYCDPRDEADRTEAPASPINKAFGRRFEIVSFRWLSPREI